jgi:hypothetical protein
VHAHWDEHGRRGEPQRGRALAAADHDEAMLLSALVALATSLRLTPIAMTVAMVMATPSERPAFRSVHVVRSHDPPLLISLSPRAPPTVRLP